MGKKKLIFSPFIEKKSSKLIPFAFNNDRVSGTVHSNNVSFPLKALALCYSHRNQTI
jgi:hypothetical protein